MVKIRELTAVVKHTIYPGVMQLTQTVWCPELKSEGSGKGEMNRRDSWEWTASGNHGEDIGENAGTSLTTTVFFFQAGSPDES